MLLSDAVDQYGADRRAQGMSPRTVKNERVTLGQLLTDVGNIHVHNITVIHLDRFWSKHPRWEPSTCNLKRIHLSVFFEWCRKRGHAPRGWDPLEGSKKRREPKKSRVIVPQSKFEELLRAAENPRDRAIVAIGLYTFVRVSEIVTLKWRDVDWDNHTITIYRHKTEEFDTLPMCEELEDELRRWHLEYGRQAGQVPRLEWFITPAYSRALWGGVKGGHRKMQLIEEARIQPMVQLREATHPIKRVLAKLGYDAEREGGHTLRRSGATALYHELSSKGHDRAIRIVQAILGHKNIATTEVYLSLDLDRKARNDLLRGRRMFDSSAVGQVVDLEAVSGEAHD